MSHRLDQTQWMSSPPLAPEDGPIDLAHLGRMTLGDAVLEREVLALFVAQSAKLVSDLADVPEDAPALAHKLKGSARAIGAFAVAEAAAKLEQVLASGAAPAEPLAGLTESVARARAAIEIMLRRPGPK